MNNETNAPKKSTGNKVAKGCGISLSVVLGLFSFLCFMIAASDSETRGIFIALAILPLIIIFCTIMAMKQADKKEKVKQENEEKGLLQQFIAKHTDGLPIAEGLPCTITAYTNRMEFVSGTTHITLNNEKITDMCVKSETEIQSQYVSSIGGATAGLVLFGPLGAIIGGRAKKKTSKTLTFYLIIAYKKADDTLAYLGFDVTACMHQANKLVKDFSKNNTQTQNIEL